MRLLLDTHVFLWLVEGNPNLSSAAATALMDPANDLYLSAASVWELAIKAGNKKITLADPVAGYVAKWTAAYHLLSLPVEAAHAAAVADLPFHHKDPFDRLLIAQTSAENMTLVTADAVLGAYGVPILW